MKIRKGFVSNSSASSFVCEYCGSEASGWDTCLSEAEMVRCIYDHEICQDHISNLNTEELEASNEDWRYELEEKHCPVCNFEVMTDRDIAKYLLKKYNIVEKDVVAEVKEKFETFGQFCDYLKDES